MNTFKVICIESTTKTFRFGEVYNVIDGRMQLSNGAFYVAYGGRKFRNVDDINNSVTSTSKFELAQQEGFTQSDLKTGMIVEFRYGARGTVLKNTEHKDGIIYSLDGRFNELNNWKEFRVCSHIYTSSDIIKVFSTEDWKDATEVLWEEYKKPIVEISMEEIARKFNMEIGDFKIVD